MERISEIRFNALAGYVRDPRARIACEELAYYESDGGKVLGLLARDYTDQDFVGIAFGRDKKLRFRWTSMTQWFDTADQALRALDQLITELLVEPDEFHHQDDEVGEPVDFFSPLHASERLHPDFQKVMSADQFSPARGIIEPMMRWHEDLDGNFVEQFQSTAFDQRIWELYLFAVLTELGYVLDSANPVPDFIGSGLFGRLAIEAVTVGPTKDGANIVPPPAIDTPEKMVAYLNDCMPIKFGSPLFSKLKKEYWKNDHMKEIPFVLAIADFSSPGSMVYTQSALEKYLYGFSVETSTDADGRSIQQPEKIVEHRWGKKVIPSGFFDISKAENVSAVISTTSGTISKFNRMGALACFGAKDVLMIREGTCINPDPDATNPLFFKAVVNADGYQESWVEGLNVYHNPRAKVPMPEHLMQGAAHHYYDPDGNPTSTVPPFHPLASTTHLVAHVDVPHALEEIGNHAVRFWQRAPEG